MLDTENKILKDIKRNLPEETYSIGLYEGSSPFDMKPSSMAKNPIISRNDFTEDDVNFVADPFGVYHNGLWYLFYESMNMGTRTGKLCVSTSPDMYSWTVGKTIIEEPFHLSYPQVIRHGEDFYMIPESYEANEVRLYKAVEFPYKWKFEKVLLYDACVDSTIHFKNNLWWLFTCDKPHNHDGLRLFYTDDLYGNWKEHPQSPLYTNNNQKSRPAGKFLDYDGRLYRFAQDCNLFYGHSVRAFEIKTLSPEDYKEVEISTSPYLAGGNEKWNRISMHHVDLHKIEENHWIAFVDGRSN